MKNIPKPFIWLFCLLFILLVLISVFYEIDQATYTSFIYAFTLNFINSFIAVIAFNVGIKKVYKIFIIFVMGGLVARLLFLLFAIIIIIKFLNINKDAFILVFFIFYFLLLFTEILYFHKNIRNSLNRNQNL